MFNRVATVTFFNKNNRLEVKGLRIVATIEKSLAGYPNLAEINIYNMSTETMNSFNFTDVILKAGYSDTMLTTIFKGDITNAHPRYDKPVDNVMQIFARDSGHGLNTIVNKSFSMGTTVANVVDSLISSMGDTVQGIATGIADCVNRKQSILRSYQKTGSIREVLDELAKDCGFVYSVNDGQLDILPEKLPASDQPVTIIQKGGILIGTPERIDMGVNVKTLLVPHLQVGRSIKIVGDSLVIKISGLHHRKLQPINIAGTYRVEKIKHEIDTHGEPYHSTILGRDII